MAGLSYEVSDAGTVRRIGKGMGSTPGRIRKPHLMNAGYLCVGLYSGNRGHGRLVHRLVAEAFVERPAGTEEVNHKDGNRLNNAASNLEWVTHIQNIHHAMESGRMDTRGELNPCAKLTAQKVELIRAEYHRGIGGGYKRIGIRYGVSWGTVRNIIKGRAWGTVRP